MTTETLIDHLRRRLRAVGASRWQGIAQAAGVSPRLLPKIAYGDRDNPRVRTIQPLLDYFAAVDRGDLTVPGEEVETCAAPAATRTIAGAPAAQ